MAGIQTGYKKAKDFNLKRRRDAHNDTEETGMPGTQTNNKNTKEYIQRK